MPRRLAQHLISQGLLPADKVDEVLRRLDRDTVAIDTLLLEQGEISEAGMLQALSDVSGYRHVNLADFEPSEEAAALLPLRIAQRLKVAPLSVEEKTLHLVVPYPVPAKQLKEVEFLIGKKLELWVGLECRIRDWLSWQYHQPLDVRFTRLLAVLDPTRAAVAQAVDTSDEPESLSDEVLDRIAKGFIEEPVLLIKRKGPGQSGGLSVMDVPQSTDHTVVIDTRAYEAFARGKHGAAPSVGEEFEEGHTTVLDIGSYGAFAREVSKHEVTADRRPPQQHQHQPSPKAPEAGPAAEPELWAVPASNASYSPPVGVFFPGGVLPPARPRGAHDSPTVERALNSNDPVWVTAAPPPRPSSERPRRSLTQPPPPPPPSAPIPEPAPLQALANDTFPPLPELDDELDFSDVAPKPTAPPAPLAPTSLKPPAPPPPSAPLFITSPTPAPRLPEIEGGPTPTTEQPSIPRTFTPVPLAPLLAPALEEAPTDAYKAVRPPHPSYPSPPPAKATPLPMPTPAPAFTPPPAMTPPPAPTATDLAAIPEPRPSIPPPKPSVPPALHGYASEWTLTQARAALKASTQERDKLIHTVLLYGRRTFDFVGFFSVSKGVAQGFDAMSEGELPAMRQITIPLDAASVFRTITLTRGSYVGPLPPDNLSKAYLQMLGREPRTVFLCPVEVKSKMVAIIYGDCGHRPMSQRKLSDFILFCQDLPVAFNELILKKRQEAKGPPISVPVPPPLPKLSPPTRPTDADWFNGLLAMLTGPEAGARRQALEWLERTPAASAKALAQHFPGPSAWSRLPVVELPEADELGPIAGAISRLGRFGAQALAPLLDTEDSDTRYLALLTAGSLPYPELVDGVLRGVFDLEPDISSAARTTASTLKELPEFQLKIPALRQELASKDPLRRALAARALGVLHDRQSIEGLIGLTGSDDALCAESAAEALKEVTCVNWGVDPRAWTSWWAGARHRRRLEWLVDALEAEDFDSRLSSIEELATAFSDNMGFFADGPPAERQAAVTRWKSFIQTRDDLEL